MQNQSCSGMGMLVWVWMVWSRLWHTIGTRLLWSTWQWSRWVQKNDMKNAAAAADHINFSLKLYKERGGSRSTQSFYGLTISLLHSGTGWSNFGTLEWKLNCKISSNSGFFFSNRQKNNNLKLPKRHKMFLSFLSAANLPSCSTVIWLAIDVPGWRGKNFSRGFFSA